MSLITYVTRIHFADRVIEDALAEELTGLRVTRPLVLTDADTRGCGDLDRLVAALPGRAPQVIRTDADQPLTLQAETVRARAMADGCDGLLALGGRAALDCARLAGLPGPPVGKGAGACGLQKTLARAAVGTSRCERRRLPSILVPTLPGEGLGLSPALRLEPAGADDPAGSFMSDGLVPDLVLCDPTLGYDLPPERLAASGFDALTHCIEAWLGTGWNPPADGIALEGVRLAAGSLVRAVETPDDIGARRALLAAGLNAGLAAPKGLGAVHALAHALEAHPRTAGAAAMHGRYHAALIPHVLAFNAPAVPERLALLGRAMGLEPGETPADALARLGDRLGLPRTLAGLDLPAGALEEVARRAEADPSSRTNPRLACAADHARMLSAAGAGKAAPTGCRKGMQPG